jgi:hypothetical protein
MNMEIGAEAAQFPEKEYISGIAVAVWGHGGVGSGRVPSRKLRNQGWAKLVLIALERYSVALKRLTFNLR